LVPRAMPAIPRLVTQIFNGTIIRRISIDGGNRRSLQVFS
jgi:hypothetical protein